VWTQLIEQEILAIIIYLLQFSHLLYDSYKSVVPYTILYNHLCYYYKISYQFCKAIIAKYNSLLVLQIDANVKALPSRSALLEYLITLKLGYFYPHYDHVIVN
jgi:hypothetical protein